MKCHSIDRGTPKRYRVVGKCKYFALNTLSGTKTQDFNPKRYNEHPALFIWESLPSRTPSPIPYRHVQGEGERLSVSIITDPYQTLFLIKR